MATLILLRHGKSFWNKNNLFTGWVDVPLCEEGVEEALRAGDEIKHQPIDYIFTSTLSRAQMTAHLAMSRHDEGKVPVVQHDPASRRGKWSAIHNPKSIENSIPVTCAEELNERFYGDLQGLDKDETRAKYGEEQVHIWRRSFDTPPPNGESLEMNSERTIPYFEKNIFPLLEQGKHILLSAHGNSLRSIVMHIEQLSGEEVLKLEIPTGKPLWYTLDSGKLIKKHG